ncbi:hypothetical protein HDV57DRAFT_497486 [Trichoderma longibrachiatum]
MVSTARARMGEGVLLVNICLSVLVLLLGSQQHLLSWAPIATFGILLSWGVTGLSLILVYHRYLLERPRQMVLYPLQIWLAFAFALHSTLADTVLLLPISTTAAMVYLASSQGSRRPQLPELPPPIPGPR